MTTPVQPDPFDKSPDRVIPTKAIETNLPSQAPGSSFQSYMETTPTPQLSSGGTALPSALSLPQQNTSMASGTPTFDSLLAQTQNTQNTLGVVGQQLQTDNLKFKRSQAQLIRNKLGDANDYLRAAADKLGVEGVETRPSAGLSMLGRLLSYIGTGQDQLVAIQGQLHQMASSGKPINAADMLMVQVKLSQATQEVEYSAALVTKMVDSLKTLFSIQI